MEQELINQNSVLADKVLQLTKELRRTKSKLDYTNTILEKNKEYIRNLKNLIERLEITKNVKYLKPEQPDDTIYISTIVSGEYISEFEYMGKKFSRWLIQLAELEGNKIKNYKVVK